MAKKTNYPYALIELFHNMEGVTSILERKELVRDFFKKAIDIDESLLKVYVDDNFELNFGKKSLAKAISQSEIHSPKSDIWDRALAFCKELNSREISGNDAIDKASNIMSFMPAGEVGVFEIILTKGTTGFSLTIINDIHNEMYKKDFIEKFQVQLADKYEPLKAHKYGCTHFYINAKLDGLRGYITSDGLKLTSRSNRGHKGFDFIEAQLKEVFKEFPKVNLIDGEMYTHGLTFSNIQAAISNETDEHGTKNSIKYNIFACLGSDICNTKQMLATLEKMRTFITKKKLNHLIILETKLIENNPDKIIEACKEYCKAGYEGCILRNTEVHYDFKRSKNLLKVKLFKELVLKVKAITKGEGKYSNVVGNLEMADSTGRLVCSCGSGLSDEQRTAWMNNPKLILNKLVEVKYFEVTEDRKTHAKSLRFPIFRGIRDDINEIGTVE